MQPKLYPKLSSSSSPRHSHVDSFHTRSSMQEEKKQHHHHRHRGNLISTKTKRKMKINNKKNNSSSNIRKNNPQHPSNKGNKRIGRTSKRIIGTCIYDERANEL